MLKFRYFLGLVAAVALLCSCERNTTPANGKLEFSIGNVIAQSEMLKSTVPDTGGTVTYGYYLMFSVETTSGETVFENEMVPLMVFGNNFLSPSIDMNVGWYRLTKLYIVDGAGSVLMAAPLQSSELAYLVTQPLPIEFGIEEGSVSRISPEVLSVDGANPSMFGYAEFEITIINPFTAYIAVDLKSPYLTDSLAYTEATLLATASNGWSHSFLLKSQVNKIVLRDNVDYYIFEVFTNNQIPVSKTFTIDELKLSTETNPIGINLSEQPLQKLELQPGADQGIDATIIDLKPQTNFGSNPYFEAGYESEPILTVMRTTNSLIYFKGISNLPKSAVIKKVTLTLWIDWGNWIMADGTTDIIYWPRGVLRQIVEPWNEFTVTWSNQPQTIDANQVYVDINPALSTLQRTYDVTSLFVPYAEVAAPNYGMMLSVSFDKSYPATIRFASSDHEQAVMHPKLTIYYSTDSVIPMAKVL